MNLHSKRNLSGQNPSWQPDMEAAKALVRPVCMNIGIHLFKRFPVVPFLCQNFDHVIGDAIPAFVSRAHNKLLPALHFSSNLMADEMIQQRLGFTYNSSRTGTGVLQHFLFALLPILATTREPIGEAFASFVANFQKI